MPEYRWFLRPPVLTWNTEPKDWAPFSLTSMGQRMPRTRDAQSLQGICDRLRAAAFAEFQARDAFWWASHFFEDAPPALVAAWRGLAKSEDLHLKWLVNRLESLGEKCEGRLVDSYLWRTYQACPTAQEFAVTMAMAEDRGRAAGERFHREMVARDPESAEIFLKIAEEEVEHIQVSERFFPEAMANAMAAVQGRGRHHELNRISERVSGPKDPTQ